MDAWANWALAPKVWKGQTVLAPELRPRGARFVTLESAWLPVRVSVPTSSSRRRAERSLQALERAYRTLAAADWPLPIFDGGYGGSSSLDLYSVPSDTCATACTATDAPLPWSDFDASQSYALIADSLPERALDACAQSALAQAGLHGADPAEAESWVRASAELSVWQLLGEWGCDDTLVHAQATPELGALSMDPASAGAGALLLALLSERHGPLLRGLWESTRQRSFGLVPGDRLRSSPDLWEVLRQALAAQHSELDDELVEFGVARYFAGAPERRARASYAVFAALPATASVPITRTLESSQLPASVRDTTPLHELGSAYVRVRLDPTRPLPQLQVWLHAELGARWSLTAVRLRADGQEVGRTSAPARSTPSSYVPIALDTETHELLLVVTQLPEQLPDADRTRDTSHGYELIIAQ